jgi:hypothetical protein
VPRLSGRIVLEPLEGLSRLAHLQVRLNVLRIAEESVVRWFLRCLFKQVSTLARVFHVLHIASESVVFCCCSYAMDTKQASTSAGVSAALDGRLFVVVVDCALLHENGSSYLGISGRQSQSKGHTHHNNIVVHCTADLTAAVRQGGVVCAVERSHWHNSASWQACGSVAEDSRRDLCPGARGLVCA